jgi:hypothetical protein
MSNPPSPGPGVPISQDEVDLLKKYRDIVMPANRLAGYDEFAKWLFTLTAVIGTLGAAFSSAALKGLSGDGVKAFFLAVSATAVSLALAVIQRSIDIPKPNWQNLDDMIQKTEVALRIKRILAWFAGSFFAAAIILAGLAPFLTARSTPEETRNSFTYSYGKDGILASAALTLPTDRTVKLDVIAGSPTGQTSIASQLAVTDINGSVKMSLSGAAPTGTNRVDFILSCDADHPDPHTLSLVVDKNGVSEPKPAPGAISNFLNCQ